MTLARVGTLPVSGINLGLQASLAGLSVEAVKLQADYAGTFPALAAQVQVTANFPPDASMFVGPIGAALNPLNLAVGFGGMSGLTVDLQPDIALKLGLVVGQIEILEGLATTLGAGLSAGGIAGWSYSGRVSRYGERLEAATIRGFGTIGPDVDVVGVILATEDFGSWGAYSEGADTGPSAEVEADTDAAALTFLGQSGGGTWNTGTATVAARLGLLLAELRGQKAALEAQASLSLGIGLPDVDVVVGAGLDIFGELGIDGVIDNLVNVQTDVSGALGVLQAQIDASVAFAASISAQLSAGGLSLWIYTGQAKRMGTELRAALASGIPGGTGSRAVAYGSVLAGKPPAMGAMGSLFRTAA